MRRRLALSAAAVTSMVVLAFVVPLAALVRDVAADRAVSAAQDEAATLVPVLAAVQDPAALQATVEAADAASPGDLSVFREDGTVLGAPAEADADVELARQGRAFTANAPGGKAVLVPVIGATGTQVVRVFVPDSVLQEGVARSWLLLALLGLMLVAVAVAVADRLARSVVAPIRELAAVAGRLGEGDLSARAVPDGPPEVVEVATAQNLLAGRIVDLLAAEREAAADLSHRLRTPITALRLDAEGLRDSEEASRIVDDVDALTRAVDRVIADARRPGRRGASDLAAVTRERVAFWSALAEDQDRSFELTVPDGPCRVAVPADDLAALLDALLGNVLAHTPEGAGFSVTVEGTTLVVDDEGPGFSEDALERGVSGGGSTGLGLDIVRRTAEAGGGRVGVTRSGRGGARVEVQLGRPAG